MSIELKYCITYRARRRIAYICANDHKCVIKGCRINIDNKNPTIVTIPFDYLSREIRRKKAYYYIQINFETGVIEQDGDESDENMVDI